MAYPGRTEAQLECTPAEVQVVRAEPAPVERTRAEVQVECMRAEPVRLVQAQALLVRLVQVQLEARATLIVQRPCRPAELPTWART